MVKIKVTNRIMWKNGDYEEEISDGKAIYVYTNPKVALNFYNEMGKKCKDLTYDGNNTVTRICEGMKAKEILDNEVNALNFAIKNKVPLLKIKWEVIL